MNAINLNKKILLFFIFSSLFLYFDFFLILDFSSGGLSRDFELTFPVVERLANFVFLDCCTETRHFPLHYFILSIFYKLTESKYFVRMIYLTIGISIPWIIFINLRYAYQTINASILLLFCTLFFYFPFFRSSLVWANAHTTGLFFLFISLFFFQKFLDVKKTRDILISLIFLSFSVYSVQYFAAIYLIIFYKLYRTCEIKLIIKLFIFCCFTAIPGLVFLKYMPNASDIPFAKNLSNVLLINLSIVFFYFCFFLNWQNLKLISQNFFHYKKNFFIFIFLLILIYILTFFFNYSYIVGGGLFFKISIFFFKNKILFFLTSFFGIFVLFFQSVHKKEFQDIIVIFLTFLLMTFSYQIYQKYFEPSFIVISLIFAQSIFFKNFFKNFYFVSTISFLYFFISFFNSYILH